MVKIRIRKLHMSDLNKLPTFLGEHLYFAKPDRSADHWHELSKEKLYSHYKERIYWHYIPCVLLGSLGLDTLVGSVAQYNGSIIGAVITRRFPLGVSWGLGPIAVHANFRRLGIATRMMNFAMKLLKEKKAKVIILPVERNNIQGRRFFEKCGFKYLEPIFSDQDRARNYVRRFTLISGYLLIGPSYKIKQYPLRRRNTDLPGIKKIRMWYIMLKEFN